MIAPKDAELRATEDFLVEKIADQAREIGVLPDVEAHRRFVRPIMLKVEEDAAEDASAAAPPAPPTPDPDEPLGPREVRWDPATNAVRVGAELEEEVAARRAEIEEQEAHRIYLRMLAEKPEWRRRILAVYLDPYLDRTRKMEGLHEIFRDAVRYFGEPRALYKTAAVMMDMGAKR